MPGTPQRWVPITAIIPLFERALDLYKTHHSKIFEKMLKSLEDFGNFLNIGETSEKVDFNALGRANDRL